MKTYSHYCHYIILQVKISNYFCPPVPSKKNPILTWAVKILLEHFKSNLSDFVLFLLYKEKQKIIRDTFKNVCFSQTVHH